MKRTGQVDIFGNLCPDKKGDLNDFKGHHVEYEIKTLTPTQERSLKQLKMYWACVRTAVDNLSELRPNWSSLSKVHLMLRILCGHVKDVFVIIKPCPHCKKDIEHEFFVPKSISFGECSHKKMCEYTDKGIDRLAKELGTTPEILKSNAE